MIEELKFAGVAPFEVGDPIDDSKVIHDRRLLQIKDGMATILYHIVSSENETDEQGIELPVGLARGLRIERYELDGEYADWTELTDAERLAAIKTTEELNGIFTDIVKQDEMSKREAEEQERIASAIRKSTTILPHVNESISRELEYQSLKWGYDKEQSLPGYLLIMQQELKEAIDGWMINDRSARNSTLEEVLQVVATGIRCLNDYGVKGNALSTSDVPETKSLEQYIIDTRAKYEAERFKRNNSLFGGAPLVNSFEGFCGSEPTNDHVYIDDPTGGYQISSSDVPFVQATTDNKEV